MKFAHLHTHSHYSLLDGLSKVPQLVARAKELGMDAMALTDHGAMYGSIEFYKAARKAGIKPILGVEAYVAPRDRFSKEANERYYHLILLAENSVGWHNLIKLVSKAHLEGFYYKPRVDRDLLREHHEGLIALSGCLGGEIAQYLLAGKYEDAKVRALEYQEIFSGGDASAGGSGGPNGEPNYFLEIQKHPNIADSEKVEAGLIRLSAETGIPLVATQDSHYIHADDAPYHDVLLAVQTGNKLADDDRLSMKEDDFSLLSEEAMLEKFAAMPGGREAVLRTGEIAARCDVEVELIPPYGKGTVLLPAFPKPPGKTANGYLRELIEERLPKKIAIAEALGAQAKLSAMERAPQAVRDRLEYELGVIEKTGFADYFLIVQDLIQWAKSHGIAVGPGRGSAAGSLVSYALDITDIDPLRYNLLFERFLNPERIQMPDIDIDFSDQRRDEVLAYAREKYGEDHVARIITFGTMAARAAIRDAGRAMGYSYAFCDQIAKLIPFNPTQGMKEGWLDECLRKVAELKALYDGNADAKKLIDTARHLEGVARHASVHACGTVITKESLTERVPVQFAPQDKEIIITQFEMHAVEDLGLLKIDFLGLKNLTIIEDTIRLIRELRGPEPDGGSLNISKIPLDDCKTFDLLQRGDTTSVFQFESSGIRRYLKELGPTQLEDIVAMVALFRPGPMELIPSFIKRKHGQERITYLHPKLKPILENTYGIGVYQEQMMQIARDLAGYTLPEADTLRKAIGKKVKSLLDEQEVKLVTGMVKNGIPEKTAKEIWELFPPFARYGFNKCVTKDTRIQDPKTGTLLTVEELYNRRVVLDTKAFSLNEETKQIYENKIVDVVHNGERPVFELKTRSGRKIKATTNHPFYTPAGWVNLEDIKVGNLVATPRMLFEPERPLHFAPHQLAVLGYVLAEGNLCHPHSFYYYSKSEKEIQDYIANLEKFANTKGRIDRSKPAASVYAKRGNIKELSEAVEWMKSLGIMGKTAMQKEFPKEVFQLANSDLQILIAKMFQGDGCINLKKNDPQIFYATSSPYIARDLQHLLLRFEIISTIYEKKFKYRGVIKRGFAIHIQRHDNIEKFLLHFSPYFVGEKQKCAMEILKTHPIINGNSKTWSARGSKDIVPVSLALPVLREAAYINQLSFAEAGRKFDFSDRLFLVDKKKIGFLRETIEYIGQKLDSPELLILSNSSIYWDAVVSIKPCDVESTYDLTMERDHNFIANDIFVHNSHAACYAMIGYQTAYLKANYPEEFTAAVLNAELSDVGRISVLIQEAKTNGVEILPPDVNKSFVNFTPEGPKIRFGLVAIKNVGSEITRAIIEERSRGGEFATFEEFLSRIQHKNLNKKSLESMLKSGAFDSLGVERKQALENIDEILKFTQAVRKGGAGGFGGGGANGNGRAQSLFGGAAMAPTITLKLKPAAPATNEEKLLWEKELIGFYLSEHPMNAYADKLAYYHSRPIADLAAIRDDKKLVRTAGIVSKMKKILTKSGQEMIFATIEDQNQQSIEVVVFNSVLEKTAAIWAMNTPVILDGRVSRRDNELKIICENAKRLEA